MNGKFYAFVIVISVLVIVTSVHVIVISVLVIVTSVHVTVTFALVTVIFVLVIAISVHVTVTSVRVIAIFVHVTVTLAQNKNMNQSHNLETVAPNELFTPPSSMPTPVSKPAAGAMPNFNPMQSFNFDVNVTSYCNLACTYCSEGESCGLSSAFQEPTEMTPEQVVEAVRGLDYNRYKDINVYWWGGEPFANYHFTSTCMKMLKDDRKVNFMYYTNGTYLKKYKKQLTQIREMLGKRVDYPWQDRLHIQISFDGEPINTKERRTKKGESAKLSQSVLSIYDEMKQDGFSVGMKPTISSRNFKYLFDVWKWHHDRGEFYGPTPDTHSVDPDRPEGAVPAEEFAQHMADLRKNLMMIVKYCVDNNIKLEESFRWFKREKQNCSAGINYLSLDLDGKTYPCHGCMYRQRDDHFRGDIKENSLQKLVDESTSLYTSYLNNFKTDTTLACNSCTADFCLKCPAGSYDASDTKYKEKTDGEKWQDHTANHQLCTVWKTLEPVSKAYRQLTGHNA